MMVYGFISFVLPSIYICEYIYYDTYGVKSPWPWQITFALDYGWFACLAVTAKMVPSNFVIRRSFELVEIGEDGLAVSYKRTDSEDEMAEV